MLPLPATSYYKSGNGFSWGAYLKIPKNYTVTKTVQGYFRVDFSGFERRFLGYAPKFKTFKMIRLPFAQLQKSLLLRVA